MRFAESDVQRAVRKANNSPLIRQRDQIERGQLTNLVAENRSAPNYFPGPLVRYSSGMNMDPPRVREIEMRGAEEDKDEREEEKRRGESRRWYIITYLIFFFFQSAPMLFTVYTVFAAPRPETNLSPVGWYNSYDNITYAGHYGICFLFFFFSFYLYLYLFICSCFVSIYPLFYLPLKQE